MRFLYENRTSSNMQLQILGKLHNLLNSGPSAIEVCVDRPSDCRVGYTVSLDGKTVIEGSYPVVIDREPKCAFVSCNDNPSPLPRGHAKFWNQYAAKRPLSLWRKLASERCDVVVHMGDQIYADSIYDRWKAGDVQTEELGEHFSSLYIRSYAEKSQRAAMTTAINLMMLDDHDVIDLYGTPGFGKTSQDASFRPFRKAAIDAYGSYQRRLRTDDDPGEDEGYSVAIGTVNFVFVDLRTHYYETGRLLSAVAMLHATLALQPDRRNIVVLPRPFDILSPGIAALVTRAYPDARDSLTHPSNLLRAFILGLLLARKNVFFVAGDAHFTYKSTIFGRPQLVTSGVCVPTISQLDLMPKLKLRALFALSDLDPLLPPKRNVDYGANYGLYVEGKFRAVTA